MNRSIKLLEALNDIDEQLLVEYKETTKEKNSHKSYKERMIGMSNLKLKYVLAPVCMVLIAVVGYVGFLNTNNNLNNNPITDFRGGKEESLATTININKIDNMIMADLDAQEKLLNDVNIPYIGYMIGLEIPSDFDNKENYKAIYVRSDRNVEKYDILNNYEFTYRNTSNNRKIIIAFSEKYVPLRDYEILDADKISKIGDVELIISQYKNMYIVKFTHKGINFDIETNDITESELISLLESIINRVDNPLKPDELEDKDVGVKEQSVEPQKTEIKDNNAGIKQQTKDSDTSGYPNYYGGKYVDKNGNNVVLLCEDNETNRKSICNYLGITESKTKFVKAKYSYNYLTELQAKISKAMSNKEFPFVTSSALMDTTNNIVVTVTTNNEKDWNKIKQLDTIGGAIEIKYSEHSAATEDLLKIEN